MDTFQLNCMQKELKNGRRKNSGNEFTVGTFRTRRRTNTEMGSKTKSELTRRTNSVFPYIYTVKGQKDSTTMNFTHYIRGNYCRKNLLELKNYIRVYKYHKIG